MTYSDEQREARFFAQVDRDGPPAALRPDLGACWLWLGSTSDGYGQLWWAGRTRRAHIVAWSLAWGELPPDNLRFKHHACGRRDCVNPEHVRPTTAVETVLGTTNVAAWYVGRSACLRGHRFTAETILTVPGGWACRTCRAEIARQRRRTAGEPSSGRRRKIGAPSA